MRIAARGLTKRFGKLEVVSRASFDIEEGELFTLLGPSGCGKTTLLRLIAGFYAPDEGEIRFDDRMVNAVPPHERGIGMVFQNYALWPHMTVFDNVAYGLRLQKLPAEEIRKRVAGVLDKVKLAALGERYPGQLSGGQQQRVALARALVLNPRILLLDEPLSNLDAKIRIQVRAEIRKLQKELGITTVYVTHDQEEALTLSDRILVLNKGAILQVGPPKALYERPANRFVADFIGINNLVEGTVKSADAAAGRLVVATPLGDIAAVFDERFPAGGRCILAIRPENIEVDGAPVPDGNVLRGRITFAAYLGHTLRYDVELAPGVGFKVDMHDIWQQDELVIGSVVNVSFAVASTVAIPAEP
ncbi:MAG TPA: ABC transporter ATP-binding protein [Usitatibacter sp.]|nr:ABC transporter ATP-binding protein [Usitatibacter sp.]